jgi:DNA-binding XRE family transcriptional regulator
MSFGGHLRALREGAGLSSAELARRAGVPASTLRNWEADRGMPALPAFLRLAGALGVPVERFAEGVEDPAGQDADPGPTPTRKGRAGRPPGNSQIGQIGRCPWKGMASTPLPARLYAHTRREWPDGTAVPIDEVGLVCRLSSFDW